MKLEMSFMGQKTKVAESLCVNVFNDDDEEENGFSLDIITD